MTRRKGGRPPLPPWRRRDAVFRVHVTEEELAWLLGQGGSEWARRKLLRGFRGSGLAGRPPAGAPVLGANATTSGDGDV